MDAESKGCTNVHKRTDNLGTGLFEREEGVAIVVAKLDQLSSLELARRSHQPLMVGADRSFLSFTLTFSFLSLTETPRSLHGLGAVFL